MREGRTPYAPTAMKWTPRTMKWFLNVYPPYLFTRTRTTYIAPDWKNMTVVLKKSFLTRNYVGTTFGGSLYAAADPQFMLMLAQLMGLDKFIMWDQSAQVKFLKPVRTDITFDFVITDEILNEFYTRLETEPVIRPELIVNGIDSNGELCVEVKKTIYIKKKPSIKS